MTNEQQKTWPDFAIGLYDKLTRRGAEVTCEFHDLEVNVPSGTAPDAPHARWKLNGELRIRTRDSRATEDYARPLV